MKQKNYSETIQKQLDSAGAVIEYWDYRTLPAVRFIGLEINDKNGYDSEYWAKTREKAISVLDTMPKYASGFDYDIALSHHFGKRVETERRHDYIGRFMKADTPVPDGYAHWDFVPNDNDMPYLTFRSQFAFSVFAGDHDTLHEHKDFDVNALYDITRNIVLEEKIIILYPEIYWTAEVQFDKANGTNYIPENLFCGERMPDVCCCGWLFSVCLKGK